jgi:predicted nicotinamide N-methyase
MRRQLQHALSLPMTVLLSATSVARDAIAEKEGPITRFANRTIVSLHNSGEREGPRQALFLTVGHSKRHVNQHSQAWSGHSMWPSGAMLAVHLWPTPLPQAGPLHVLELACGSAALPGVALALSGHHVIFADLPEVLPLVTKNVQLNARKWGLDLSSRTKFMRFKWQDEVPLGLSFDLIVASDITFVHKNVQDIRRWLRTLVCRNANATRTEALIAGVNRNGTLSKLMQGLSNDGVEVRTMQVPKPFSKFKHPHAYSRLELHRLTCGVGMQQIARLSADSPVPSRYVPCVCLPPCSCRRVDGAGTRD